MNPIKTENWKAWIEQKDAKPEPVNTLHITAEAIGNAVLVKKEKQGDNSETLLLDLKTLTMGGIAQRQQIHYTETLANDKQYSKIKIVCQGELVVKIEEIGVVH